LKIGGTLLSGFFDIFPVDKKQLHMKKNLLFTLLLMAIISCRNETKKGAENQHQHTNTPSEETLKKKSLSPHTFAMNMIGGAHIHIDYSSPSTRGRIIFGGLLAYDEVWQSGAHQATWFETNKDLILEGNVLKAGKYGLFTIPSKDEWTVIFNSNWDQHGKDEYDAKEDVLRFKVKPEYLNQKIESLKYKVERISDMEGTISLGWENVLLAFHVKVE